MDFNALLELKRKLGKKHEVLHYDDKLIVIHRHWLPCRFRFEEVV